MTFALVETGASTCPITPSGRDPLNAALLLDRATVLGSYLTRQDRVGLRHGLEIRVPYLDHELARFANGLPSSFKLHDGIHKWLLRRVAERRLPHTGRVAAREDRALQLAQPTARRGAGSPVPGGARALAAVASVDSRSRAGVRLAFAETAAQALAIPSDCRIVALEPHAQVALEHAGIAFSRPEEYMGWDELEQAGAATFATLEGMCAAIDEIAAEHVEEIRLHELRPALWHMLDLKPLYDGGVLTAMRLRRIIDAEDPDEVVWFDSQTHASHVLDLLMQTRGGCATRLPDPTPQPVVPARRLRSSALTAAAGARRRLEGFSRGLRIVLLDSGYSLPAIGAELARLGHRPVRSNVRRAPRALPARLWASVADDPRVRAAFVQDGLDLWPAAAARLGALLESGLPRVVAEHTAWRQAFERRRPDAVVTSMAAVADQKAACHAARRLGVPVIVSRHGELGTRHVPMVAYQDVRSVDWALCWGRWEADWVARHGPGHVGVEIVGSPMIEEAIARAPERARIRATLGIPEGEYVALYVPTALSNEQWYASRRTPDDSTYFRQETRVVDELLRLGFRVVVKEHTFGRPTPLELWCGPLPGVDVLYEPRFSDLIHLADVIVLDAPSTTLVEALFGSASIVIVDHPVFAWEPGIREHLTRHGIAFATLGTLSDAFDSLPAGGFAPVVREPLISVEDEPAALRAARAIIAIAQRAR